MKVNILREGVRSIQEGKGNIIRTIDPICSAITLIQGTKNILIDTGNLGYEGDIIKKLESFGLIPEQIDYVINTHLHFDHCSNNYLFRNAIRVAGQDAWVPEKRCDVYKKTEDIIVPDVKIIATPGHKEEHISVIVKTDKTYVIAGDAIEEERIRTNFYKDNPNKEQIIDSILKILDIADIIIPGHGPIIEKKTIEELKQIVASWR